jgi:hypothetical protein
MSESGRRKVGKAKARQTKTPSEESQAKAGKAVQAAGAGEGAPRPKRSASARKSKSRADRPQVVLLDGVAYVEGCDVPIWRLEMARRAGSGRDALIGAFPDLTRQGLDLAFAYARRHRAEVDALIQQYGPRDVPAEVEEDEDSATFEAELAALFTEKAEVFRRLAQ